MTDREKQIEEMASDLEREIPEIYAPELMSYARRLYDLGYRKTFTSSLATDEQKAIMSAEVKQSRKETAREILQSLVGHTFSDDGWTWTVSKDDMNFLAEKYGIEVEE